MKTFGNVWIAAIKKKQKTATVSNITVTIIVKDFSEYL